MMLFDVLIFVSVILMAVYLRARNTMRKFTKAGVPQLDPAVFFGNFTRSALRLRHVTEDIEQLYKAFPNERYFGVHHFSKSFIVLKDPDLIKAVTVRDFDSFVDHRPFFDDKLDPLFGRNVFSLKGDEWRVMRSTLSPAFTSSKTKAMTSFMSKIGQQVNDYLLKEVNNDLKTNGDGSLEVELKDLTTRYTNDVIASTAFGIGIDSLADKTNDFYQMVGQTTNFDGYQLNKFFGYLAVPQWMSFFRIKLFDESMARFYRNMVQGTIKHREENDIQRPDMIQQIMKAKKGTLKREPKLDSEDNDVGYATVQESELLFDQKTKTQWTEDDLTAQIAVFFLAGYETTATGICLLMFELALNQDVQEKLKREIDEVVHEDGPHPTYETFQKMKYMDMVVSEILRLWPPVTMTDRQCTKDYNLGPFRIGSNKEYTIKKNEAVWIPVMDIQRDAKYWRDPYRFDPERFSDENKDNIKPYTYIPFGTGPRNCIGVRFGLVEMKIFVFYVLSKFELVTCEKTRYPVILSTKTINLGSDDGFWVKFLPRNKS